MSDLALVYVDLELAGLDDALGVPPQQLLHASDEPDADQRARVKVLVTGGPLPLPVALVDSFPALATIVSVAAGYDGIDLAHARSRGIRIGSAIGVNADDVADLAVGSLIALVRGIVAGDRVVRAGGWLPRRVMPTRSVGSLRAGVVGMGAIGQAIARRVAACGCQVAWHGPRPKDVEWPRTGSLTELARNSEVLFVAAPLVPGTAGMIDAATIAELGPEGYLVNVGRGGLVDEDALIAALKEGRLAGAALDVFATEPTLPERWADVPNTVLTPHIGGVTHQSLAGVFARAGENVRRALAGEELLGRVA